MVTTYEAPHRTETQILGDHITQAAHNLAHDLTFVDFDNHATRPHVNEDDTIRRATHVHVRTSNRCINRPDGNQCDHDETERLEAELALTRDTLRARTEALHRVTAELDTLRAQAQTADRAPDE